MPIEFTVKRIDDQSLYRIFQEAMATGQKEIAKAKEANQLAGDSHKLQIAFSTKLPWQFSEDDLETLKPGNFAISNAAITFSLTSKIKRVHPAPENVLFSYSRGENGTLLDRLTINASNQSEALQSAGEQSVLKAMHQVLSQILAPVVPEDGGLVPTLSNLAESFNTTYQRISNELSDAVSAVSQERSDQITEFQEERKRLSVEIANERQLMKEAASKEIGAQKAELAKEKELLDKEWAKLEISSHKDSRRKQFQRLQEDLQDALQSPLSDRGFRKTRWAIFCALVLAGLAAGFFAHDSITSGASLIGPDTNGSWLFPAIRSFILTLASLTAFFGAAAWLRYFYVRDLSAQEELQRFRNDMARASWVMDAALEIRKEHDEEIPPEWITGVTQGLFAAKKKDTLEEGAHALAALMGLSASATFGPSGATVELGKKGRKAVAEAAKSMQQD